MQILPKQISPFIILNVKHTKVNRNKITNEFVHLIKYFFTKQKKKLKNKRKNFWKTFSITFQNQICSKMFEQIRKHETVSRQTQPVTVKHYHSIIITVMKSNINMRTFHTFMYLSTLVSNCLCVCVCVHNTHAYMHTCIFQHTYVFVVAVNLMRFLSN